VILILFVPVAALNGDTQSASNIKYAAILEFRSADLLPAGEYGGGSTNRTEIVVAVHHASPDLGPMSRGSNVESSAVIQVGHQL